MQGVTKSIYCLAGMSQITDLQHNWSGTAIFSSSVYLLPVIIILVELAGFHTGGGGGPGIFPSQPQFSLPRNLEIEYVYL